MAEETKKAAKKEKIFYTKRQILESEKFRNRKDLAEAVLEKGKKYTLEDVDKLIEKYLDTLMKATN